MSPIEKFRAGIRRIMRIAKSYKSSALTELLQMVAEKVKKDKNKNEKRRQKMLKRTSQLTPIERNEQSIIALTEKVEQMKDTIETQNAMITTMKDELISKMEQLNMVRLAPDTCDTSDSNSSGSRVEQLRKKFKVKNKKK